MLKVKLISLENNSNIYINVPKKSEFYGPSQNGTSTNMGGGMAPSNCKYQSKKGNMAPYSYDGGCDEQHKDYAYGVDKGVSPYNHQGGSGYNSASVYNHEGGNRELSAYKNYDGECKGYNHSYAHGGGKGVAAYQKTYQSAPENCEDYDSSSDDDDYYATYPYRPSNKKKSCGWFW
ncbi:uncharacterized protein LOC111053602 isoform X2 [Nilaparvata lugens]|uniref:uncharacterized protein LOC111053602 isoform X2 n=1 Tax=Nilaparvata lugens TaxID=108931 RepID=UPI00193D837F|nr:uncharacterized protein LOC111053602 isoform X2 [Nilaparvata lugens]